MNFTYSDLSIGFLRKRRFKEKNILSPTFLLSPKTTCDFIGNHTRNLPDEFLVYVSAKYFSHVFSSIV